MSTTATPAKEAFLAKVTEYMAAHTRIPKAKAIACVIEANPNLHRAMLIEANPNAKV